MSMNGASMITIEFEIQSEHGVFRDAIVLPDDHNVPDEQIEAIKQARYQAWVAAVTAPSEEPVEVSE